MIQSKVQHQLRSERPHSPQNDPADDEPDQAIGRGEVNLRAGGFWLRSAQDVIWVRYLIKPARNGQIIGRVTRVGKAVARNGVADCAWRRPSTGPGSRSPEPAGLARPRGPAAPSCETAPQTAPSCRAGRPPD